MFFKGRRLRQVIESQITHLAATVKAAEVWYIRYVTQIKHEHQQHLNKNQVRYAQALDKVQAEYEKAYQEIQHRLRTYKADYQQTLNEGESIYKREQDNVQKRLQVILEDANPLISAWNHPLWSTWTPSSESDVLQGVRIGRMIEKDQWDELTLVALLPFIGNRPLLLKLEGTARSQAIQAIKSLLLRLLATIPPGKLRFTFLDPVGLGQNVAGFMHLADYDDQLVTSRAWTEPRQIEQQLASLTEQMTNVIQKYLRNQYATIEAYNEQAGEVAEPYRVLVVMDFPANFSEEAARRLVSIAQNGPRCGVYAVIMVDTSKPLPHGFTLADLERASTVIAWDGNRFLWPDQEFKDCLLALDSPPNAVLFNRIVNTVGEAAKDAGKVEVPFERIAPSPEEWWTSNTRKRVQAPLGPSGARKLQLFNLGKGTAQHVLVVGKTGSGKSTLLHVLIMSLALSYSPDEVQLYLIDFKKGVEFKSYATHQFPHARVIAIESEREFGLSVLQGLDAELKRRGDLFRKAGVNGLADYRDKSSQPMPRILLLVDEFQEFFTEDDRLASQAAQVLERLVRQGRAFGIHLLLGSQTLAGTYSLARSTVDQMAVRIALQCSDADSRLILADDNPAARLLSRPGEAIYNAANGMVEGNNRFQVAWLPDDKRDDYLQRIRTLAKERGYTRLPIIFEGNAPAEVEKNQQLHNLLQNSPLPEGEGLGVRAIPAWLGDPIAIREAVAATFRRQSGSNLLVVGQDDEAALGMMSIAFISLAAQLPPDKSPTFYILNFGSVDGSSADLLPRLAKLFPHTVKIGRRRQLPTIINTLATEVQRRIEAEDALLEESEPTQKQQSIYLLIYGLQRARDLRQGDSFGSSFSMPSMPSFDSNPFADSFEPEPPPPPPPNPAQQFQTLLRDGPEVGVHSIVWCDTVTNLNRTLERQAQGEFVMRVAFQMSTEDSTNLVDTPAASKLGQHRALFYDEEENRMEKFRPYGIPSQEWLAWVGEQLRLG